MGIVLGEAAHAQEPVQHARTLVAIDGPELGVAERQLAVAPEPVTEDRQVEGTVHRLDQVLGPLDLDPREHVLLVERGVPGDVPEGVARQVGRHHQVVAVGEVLLAPVLLGQVSNAGPLGVPEDEAAADGLVDREQVEVLAELAVVALLGLFQTVEVLLELLLAPERGPVDARQHPVPLVAAPVGAGHVEELERADLPGGLDVGAAAESDTG